MSEDILYKMRKEQSRMDFEFSDVIFNEALILLEDKCLQISNRDLKQLGLQSPKRNQQKENRLFREHTFNTDELKSYVESHKKLLNIEQNFVFETILTDSNNNIGGIYFLDAPGGTGEIVK